MRKEKLIEYGNLTLEELFKLLPRGVNIRQMAQTSHELFHTRHFNKKLGDVKYFDEKWKRELIKRPRKPHKHDGKWAIRIQENTSKIVYWESYREDLFISDSPKECIIKLLNHLNAPNLNK